jgi:hypothetical protein
VEFVKALKAVTKDTNRANKAGLSPAQVAEKQGVVGLF